MKWCFYTSNQEICMFWLDLGSLDWMIWWLTIFIVFVSGLGPAMGWLSDAYIFLSGIYPDFIQEFMHENLGR